VLVRARIDGGVLTVLEQAVKLTDSITTGTALIGTDGDTPVYADANTHFYYYSTSDGDYDSYLGYENAPTVNEDLTEAYYLEGSGGTGNAGTVLV
jgi:hypothetical protein